MVPWTRQPEAAALLASFMVSRPRRRTAVYRFQETVTRFVGKRVARLHRLYRDGEPPLDCREWKTWLALDPQRVIAEAIGTAIPSPPLPPTTGKQPCMKRQADRSPVTAG